MRSASPIPGNPWPHDMSIRVEDEPHALLELLWVREVYGLRPPGDVPPALEEPPVERLASPDAASWSAAWSELWRDVLTHAASVDRQPLAAQIDDAPPGSPERLALLKQLVGPTWRDRFGGEGLDASFSGWCTRRVQRCIAGYRSGPLQEHPEWRALDALIPAWKAGLTLVIEIPCRGEYTRVAGASALLVTGETRADPERYAEALTAFAARARDGS